MNIILEKSKQIDYHTQLDKVLEPVINEIEMYKWILSDLEFIASEVEMIDLPINYDKDFFILNGSDFRNLVNKNIQIVWGVVIAVSMDCDIVIEEGKHPYSEGNDLIWEKDKFQMDYCEMEIICWDSSRTIIKSKSDSIFEKIRYFFPEAKELD